MYGFSPQVAFSTKVHESNAQLYDFQRNLWKCAGSGSFKDSLLPNSWNNRSIRQERWLDCLEQVASCRYVDLRAGCAAAGIGVGLLK